MLQRGGQVGSGEPYHWTTAVPMQSKGTTTKVQIARANVRGGGRGGRVKARRHTGMRTKAAILRRVVGGGRDELPESTSSVRG